jgi:hypothetical protein
MFEARALEEFLDFFVGRLCEVDVPLTDGIEIRRLRRTHDVVSDLGETAAGFRRADRHRNNYVLGLQVADRFDRRFHRRSRREPIVHENDRLIFDGHRGQPVPVLVLAAIELGLLGARDRLNDLGGYASPPHDLAVQHPDAAASQRAHRQLGLTGEAKLSHEKDIKGRADTRRDFETHWDATPREGKHQHIRSPRVTDKFVSECPTGGATVGERLRIEHASDPRRSYASRSPSQPGGLGPFDAIGKAAQ